MCGIENGVGAERGRRWRPRGRVLGVLGGGIEASVAKQSYGTAAAPGHGDAAGLWVRFWSRTGWGLGRSEQESRVAARARKG